MIDSLLHRQMLLRWSRDADKAHEMGLNRLRNIRGRAWSLRTQIDRLLRVANPRLADVPAIRRPPGTDWSWRPASLLAPLADARLACGDGQSLGSHVTVFHDCPLGEIGLRQVRGQGGGTPFSLQLDVYGFRGSYLSLALDLPVEAAQGLLRRHVIALSIDIAADRPQRVTARLNIQHGPNLEQLRQEVPEDGAVEFDLAYADLRESRVEKMWVDLFFEEPEMNHILLRDITAIRRPRAEV
ncbi:DUF6478 family protein [Falsirhodobacter algicola]|uniref:Uncharacterized protein n=1 Tax=Falsirhodobacter algicola TaxID=2692330 RepID=A0A8J8MT55_9RHOB|nr:DUF6478 family protein [Falsirhodobacter algicola]QUS35989.1 hypothetical protein GR316_06755 [Falsirhodobacter algicola]